MKKSDVATHGWQWLKDRGIDSTFDISGAIAVGGFGSVKWENGLPENYRIAGGEGLFQGVDIEKFRSGLFRILESGKNPEGERKSYWMEREKSVWRGIEAFIKYHRLLGAGEVIVLWMFIRESNGTSATKTKAAAELISYVTEPKELIEIARIIMTESRVVEKPLMTGKIVERLLGHPLAGFELWESILGFGGLENTVIGQLTETHWARTEKGVEAVIVACEKMKGPGWLMIHDRMMKIISGPGLRKLAKYMWRHAPEGMIIQHVKEWQRDGRIELFGKDEISGWLMDESKEIRVVAIGELGRRSSGVRKATGVKR